MNEVVTHYHIDFNPCLEKEVWKIRAERFDIKIDRRCHSEDGSENNAWMTISDTKPEE